MSMASATQVDEHTVRAALDDALADAIRRASTRSEHIRLVRIAHLISMLTPPASAPPAPPAPPAP